MKINQSTFGYKAISFLVAFILILGSLPAIAAAATLPYNSVVAANTIPSTMIAGTTYRVSITFRNSGSATWTNAAGYRLKAVGGTDPFASATSYTLAASDAIKTNMTKAFTISMTAPATAGTYTTDWRMYRSATAFGATFTKSVKVIPLVLTSIAITRPANKTNYYIGEKLDLTGMVVTGTYNNGSKKTLPITTANVTGFNSTRAVTGQVLTITYGGKSTTYKVNILNILLQSIAITKAATKLNYYVGEPLNLTGLVVTGTYSNGVKKALPITTANVTGFNSSKPANAQVLTITYGGKTTTYKVNILPILVTDVVITGGDTVVNGYTLQLGSTVTPANATNKTITWAVDTLAGGAATIDSTGLLTASAAGTVTVTATNAASGIQDMLVVTILPVDPVLLAAATSAVESLEAAAAQDLTLEANLLAAEEAVIMANTETGKLPPVAERTALEARITAAASIITAARAAYDAIMAAADTAVAAYEAAPTGTLVEITAAEGLKAPAEAAVAVVTDTTAKAAFQIRINNKSDAIATAKAVLQSESSAQASAETAVAALEAAPLTNIAQINTATGLKTTAETKASLVLDVAVRSGFVQRITAKTIAMAVAELNLQTYFGSMEAALEKYNPVLGLDFTAYRSLSNRVPVQNALLTPVFVTVADIKTAFDSAVAAQQAAESSPVAAFNSAATTADVAAAITAHATALSLGLTEYNAIANKVPVQTELLGRTYATGEEIKIAFIIAVMNNTNDAGVRTLLSNNAVILGLSSGYSSLSTKSLVEAAAIATKPIANRLEIIVAGLNGTNNEWFTDQLLTINKTLLGLDLTDYSGFEFRNKMKVQTAMIAATLTNVSDVQTVFNSNVATQKAFETAGVQAFLNAATTTEIASAITTYLTVGDLYDYGPLMNKEPVHYELLIRTSFASLQEVKTVLDAAAAKEKALEATAMAAINNAATPDAMHAAILANAVTLGLVLSDYNTFSAADQAVVQNTMVAATFYATSVLKTTFDTAVATQKAVITVNQTDAAGMGAVLTASATALGLNISDYNLLTQPSKDIVHAALVGRAFADKAAVATAFETAVSVPIINEITTTAAMATAISRYATVLGLNLTDYGALFAPYNVTVQTALLAPTFANAAEVKTAFDAAVALAKEAKAVAAVNTAATAAAMHTALTGNAATLGLTLTDYNTLANKVPVQTALLTPVFNTAAEVKAAFDTAVAVQRVNEAAVAAMGQTLTANATVLGLDLTDYTALLYKEPVHTAMETPVFATAADVKTAFDAAVAAEKDYEAPLLSIPAVRLNKPAITLVVNGSETLIATVLPFDAVNRDVTWATDNDTVASVDANGAVTAISAGTATITVTAVDGGYTDTCLVTVVVPATGVTLNKTSLIILIGSNETLVATVLPANATNKNVTWTSANPALFTVDANGKVTGVAAGVAANVTVKTVDGNYTATCSVRAITEATAVSAINNAIFTSNSMHNTILSYGAALGLDLTEYNALYEYEQGQVQMALLNPVFTSAAQIRTVFNTAVAIQVISMASEADLGAALTSKAALLGLNLTAYNQLSDKAAVHTMLEPASFTTAAEIQAALDEAVAIQQINLASEAQIGATLANNAALLGLDLTAYNALGDKAPVDAALAVQTFLAPWEIQTALDMAVAVQEINLAAEADLGAALNNYAAILGLDLTAYLQLLDTAPVHAALAPQTFTTAAEIQAALDTAVAAQALIEAGG